MKPVVFDTIIPLAADWVREQSRYAQLQGVPLSDAMIDLAHAVGVVQAKQIRVLLVDQIPIPSPFLLRKAAQQTRLWENGVMGLALGHSIFLCRGTFDKRVLSHELRHVHQYERFGSVEAFLNCYIQEVYFNGYYDAALEVDARQYESVADQFEICFEQWKMEA